MTRLVNDRITIDIARWHRTGYLARQSVWQRVRAWLVARC